jgi:predicted PurR-regulated permease PerM
LSGFNISLRAPFECQEEVGGESERPIPVEVQQPTPGPFAIVQTIAGTPLSPLETTFIVVIFILLQREDLRNRFIRLVGSSDSARPWR